MARLPIIVSSSGPASPTIAEPCERMPPFARYGILGIYGILIPKCPPPSQLGMVKLIEFKPLIKLLIAPIAPFSKPMIPFNGAFTIFTRLSNKPPKILTTPCHACSQFPVKTP